MTALLVFKGWTVDPRLRQFRKVNEVYGIRTADFTSRTGRQLRADMHLIYDALAEASALLLERASLSADEAAEFRRRAVDDDSPDRAEADFERLTRMDCRTETYQDAAALVAQEMARYVL